MISRKTVIRRQFNRSAAGSYDTHANVQRDMAKKLMQSLKPWTSGKNRNEINILEIGCGTGTLTEMLLNEWPNASITAIDIAPAMIKAAEERIRLNSQNNVSNNNERSSRVQFLHADIEMWAANAPIGSFDLIVSNACFQWLSDPQQTLEYLNRLLCPGGLLTFTTFGPETFRELHLSFQEVYLAAGMEYQRHGLSFQTAEQWRDFLTKSKFHSIQYEQYCRSEEYASAREFLLAVKAQGASTSEAASNSPALRRLFADMFKVYEDKFSTLGGVYATYDVLLISGISKQSSD
ncbi:malonyl-ACP O-methyltransferase BioC [Paenibacillus sp. NPDC058071]|uniref:malonyl-ACP O-methyltransferase BioC n=1 Tax=Paenibacillus sp. NPDC058071 TaxID=3346326 RepID=UPI0036DAC1C6